MQKKNEQRNARIRSAAQSYGRAVARAIVAGRSDDDVTEEFVKEVNQIFDGGNCPIGGCDE